MFEIRMPSHGHSALAPVRDNFFHKTAQALLGALTLAVISVLFCSAAHAQAAHFSWTQTQLNAFVDVPYGVAVDPSGNVYVAAVGDTQIVEIVAVNGSIPAAPSTNLLGANFNTPYGVAVDANGNVYVADYGNSEVKEIPPGCITSSCVKILGAGFSTPTGVAVDAHGNVFVADEGNNKVKEIPPGCISTLCVKTLGSGFSSPRAVAVDTSGNVYVANGGTGWVLEMVAVSGSIPATPTIYGLSQFSDPEGVAVDGGGNVYVTDGVLDELWEIPAGGVGDDFQLGTGWNGPEGVAVDSTGRVFVANNYGEHVVQVAKAAANFGAVNVNSTSPPMTLGFTFDTGGQMVPADVLAEGVSESDFADAKTGSCTTNGFSHNYVANEVCTMDVTFTPSSWGPRYGAVELRDGGGEVMAIGYVYGVGIAPLATFSVAVPTNIGTSFGNITGLALDGFGDLFVADNGKNATEEIEPSGASETVTSKNSPYAVAMDGGGNLYLAVDTGPPAIFEYFAVGDYTSFRQLATSFTFNYITGLAVDGNGNVFVADYLGESVYEITNASNYVTVNTLTSGTKIPYGIAVDVNGNLFFSNDNYNSIEEIAAPGYSSVKILNSSFNQPYGIALDGNDNIYVADYGNNALEEIMASGGYATVNTLAANVTGIQAVTLDSFGHVYYAVAGGSSLTELDYTASPTINFPPTAEGSVSSPLSVMINNLGNQELDFLAVGYPEHFPENLNAANDCYTHGDIPAQGSCTVSIEFAPRTLGEIISEVVLVDNSLYPEWYAYQEIEVIGTSLHTQAITFTDSLPASANYSVGLSYTLSATGGTSGNPVTFSLVSGPATVVGSSLNITGAGTVVVAANQAGNATYAAAPQVTQSITIKLASQTITFPAITATQYAGTTLPLSASASSGLTVAFASTTPTVCTVSGTTASLLISGACAIQATQAGSTLYAAAPMVQQTLNIHHQSQTITFSPITATQYALTQLPLTATASSGLTVAYTSTTLTVCTVAGSTASLLTTGTCILQANQAGNATYSAAPQVSQYFTVHLATQTISFPAITATEYAATTLPLSATATSGLTVVFTSTTPTICTVLGTTATLVTSGTCGIQATQSGNSLYAAAPLVQQNIAVHHQTQTINFPQIASQIVGANVTLSATASSGLAVAFSATGTVCSVSGTTATMLTTGTCTIHANQAGNGVYSMAPQVAMSFAVKAGS